MGLVWIRMQPLQLHFLSVLRLLNPEPPFAYLENEDKIRATSFRGLLQRGDIGSAPEVRPGSSSFLCLFSKRMAAFTVAARGVQGPVLVSAGLTPCDFCHLCAVPVV